MEKYGPRSTDGGVDELALSEVAGRLWMCGKHAIGPDVEEARARAGDADVVVCLVERHELVGRYDAYLRWLDSGDPSAMWRPIPDLHAPSVEVAAGLVTEIVKELEVGRGVLLHCAAGIGRTGTLAAAVLMRLGEGLAGALERVGAARPMAGPEAGTQMELLMALAPATEPDAREPET